MRLKRLIQTGALFSGLALAQASRAVVTVQEVVFQQDARSLRLELKADGPLAGRVEVLKDPDRFLIALPDARLATRRMSKEIGVGEVLRARLAEHIPTSVWLVVDLAKPIKYSQVQGLQTGFALNLFISSPAPSAAPSPVPTAVLPEATQAPTALPSPTPGMEPTAIPTAAPTAVPTPLPQPKALKLPLVQPKISLMLFDLRVLFQGKQYDRFPCANLIYDRADRFPLKREFISTLVFHHGSGSFVGNMRILDPQGVELDRTHEAFAFNLFNEISDYSVEIPWKLEFPSKGSYTLVLSLNGKDAMEYEFYVGYADDKPAKP